MNDLDERCRAIFAITICVCIVTAIVVGIYGIWFETTMVLSMKILCTAGIVGAVSYACFSILED